VREGYTFLYWQGSIYNPGDVYGEMASDDLHYVGDYLTAIWESTPKLPVKPDIQEEEMKEQDPKLPVKPVIEEEEIKEADPKLPVKPVVNDDDAKKNVVPDTSDSMETGLWTGSLAGSIGMALFALYELLRRKRA